MKMRPVGAKRAALRVTMAALFAATTALPGSALYQHQHRNGDLPHVHDDGEGLLAELLEHHHHRGATEHDHHVHHSTRSSDTAR